MKTRFECCFLDLADVRILVGSRALDRSWVRMFGGRAGPSH